MLTFHFEQVDSTNSRAAALAARHAGEVVLVSAARQTAGRGRAGRTWVSPEGGAWFSLAWPLRRPPQAYDAAPLVAGLAVLRTLRAALNHTETGQAATLALKWPNDILLNDRKVAGILCERIIDANAGLPPTLIVGVGVNVNLHREDLGDDLRHPATTLQDVSAIRTPLQPLIEGCAERLASELSLLERAGLGPATLQRLRGALAWVGMMVELQQAEERIVGLCRGIDDQGRLLVQQGGRIAAHEVGDLRLRLAAMLEAVG